MVELLAPAGSREAFAAALESGADAVYLGGRLFGARHYAPNFSDQELAEAVREAHLRNVAVHVTVNTLIDDSEIPELVTYLQHLYTIGVDAIIVQDIGVAQIARMVTPELPLHASTQMTAHNLDGVEFLAAHGFSRVVLARELSLDSIRHICRNTMAEIEVFVHGALCISYSGQCLMSSMIGGRSGNRGKCAQPCRLPYQLVDKNGNNVLNTNEAGEYLLSPKDFCTIELLPELIDAGVRSLKIEGRMKRAEYVAVVVDSYRRALDRCQADKDGYNAEDNDIRNMAQTFNRGFTTAYLQERPGKLMMSDRRPNNRGTLIGRVTRYDQKKKIASIRLEEPLSRGDIIEFWVKVGGRVNLTVSSFEVNGVTADFAVGGDEASMILPTAVRPGDRVFKTFDRQLMDKAKTFYTAASPIRRIPVSAEVEVAEGKPLTVTLKDYEGCSGRGETAFLAEPAIKRALDRETIEKQVNRIGNTVFALKELTCDISGHVMVPVSEINEARRQAAEALVNCRLARYERPALKITDATAIPVNSPKSVKPPKTPVLVVNADTAEKAEAALTNGADVIMFGAENYQNRPILPDEYRRVVYVAREKGKEVVLSTPRIIHDGQMKWLMNELELFAELSPDRVSVANIGMINLLQNRPEFSIVGDYPLNIYNTVAVDFYAKAGFKAVTLSPELNFEQVEHIAELSDIQLECLVHGYLPLMVSEYCPVGSFLGGLDGGKCNKACRQGTFWLKDRKAERFKIATDQFCRMHLLNAKELNMLSSLDRFRRIGINRLRIEGKAADAAYIALTTRLYRKSIDNNEHQAKVAEDDLKRLEHADTTRGHYFRGVL